MHRHSQEHIGGDLKLLVSGIDGDGNVDIVIKFNRVDPVHKNGHLHVKGSLSEKVVIEAATGLTLKVPGGFITIDAGGIAISGTVVKINSGGSALTGSGAQPETPREVEEASPTVPTQADSESSC